MTPSVDAVKMKEVPGAPNRRIEVISGGKALPMTPDLPVLTSAGIGWQGFLLEKHLAKPPFEAPEHHSSRHILHFHTSPASTDWRIDGRIRHTTEQPGSVTLIPAGSQVAAIITGNRPASALALEIDASYVESIANGVGVDRLEFAERLAVRDLQVELLMNAMQSDLASKVRSFLAEAREAARVSDWTRASTAAKKAEVLSQELAGSL